MIVLTKIELGSTDFAKVDAKRLLLKCYFVMGVRGRLIDRSTTGLNRPEGMTRQRTVRNTQRRAGADVVSQTLLDQIRRDSA